jgi:TolA-binding protein
VNDRARAQLNLTIKLAPLAFVVIQALGSGPSFLAYGAAPLTLGDRQKLVLPESRTLKVPPQKTRNLGEIKPPRSSTFYEARSREDAYEQLVDEEIKTLYNLSQQNKKSPNRGEVWLRLGERYVEKARLVEFRAQADFDKKLKDYVEKRTPEKPQIQNKLSHEYNQKAVQLFEWFVNDFPNDSKVDQALFFLGYNQFELGRTQLGEVHYATLLKRFPNSAFVIETHFAMGEYYFENEQWKKAYEHYDQVIQAKKARLNVFALYKSSWCLYRINRVRDALKNLERVIRLSRASAAPEAASSEKHAVNKVRLESEAIKDYVPFYAELDSYDKAGEDFARVANDSKTAIQMLERLAYVVSDNGNRIAANTLFRKLIAIGPYSERAAEYQYQIVLSTSTSDQKEFHKELEIWLETFGPKSQWVRENSGNKKLIEDLAKLQETTLRNHVLQLHQTAQNSRASYSQQMASAAYAQYMKYFPDSPQIAEMRFFQAELLFDMQRFEDAGRLYSWVAENFPKGPYGERAVLNTLLSLEKDLPPVKTIEEKRGKSIEKMEFDPAVERFEKGAKRYLQTFPNSEKAADIRRRLGVLYYSYNHFDEAIDIFEKLIKENPKSENAEIAGNLILDTFKLKGDVAGLVERARKLLTVPEIAQSKFGTQIRELLDRAVYVKAEKAASSAPLESAKDFEAFAQGHANSDLVIPARFKAAEGYEKAGDLISAIRMYSIVVAAPLKASDTSAGQASEKMRNVQSDSRNALAQIYQKIGQLELAAKQYQAYAESNAKDSKAIDAFFNAGLLWDSLGAVNEAMRNYQMYFNATKRSDRNEVLYSQADLQRRRGSASAAIGLYDQYLQTGSGTPGHQIEACYWIATLSLKQGKVSIAKDWYTKVINKHHYLEKSSREDAQKAAGFAAEGRFFLSQETMAEINKIRFTSSEKDQAKSANQLKKLRDQYISQMKEVIRYDNGTYIIAALTSSGQMFEAVAHTFGKVPVPVGFSAEDSKKFHELIQQQVNGFEAEARNSYKAAADKSKELETFNRWTSIARQRLSLLSLVSSSGTKTEMIDFPGDSRAADWMGL